MASRGRSKKSDRWDRTPPTQLRGQATLQRILRSTEELLTRKPFHLITLGEIVRKARTNTGSFYARFSSKEAVLPLLYERHMARVEATQIRKIQKIFC